MGDLFLKWPTNSKLGRDDCYIYLDPRKYCFYLCEYDASKVKVCLTFFQTDL